jgi:hypothetical protein
MKYGELNLGQIEAVVNKLGGMEGVNQFLRGELVLSQPNRRWREEGGIIYFSVTSSGITGEQWVSGLERNGFKVSDSTKRVLCSADFKPTNGITYEIAVFMGKFFSDDERITKNIRKDAKIRKLITPNAEVACLIREKFFDKELKAMGLYWIITMHKPIKDSEGNLLLLYANRNGNGSWLDTDYDNPGDKWGSSIGFAFVVSQVSSS